MGFGGDLLCDKELTPDREELWAGDVLHPTAWALGRATGAPVENERISRVPDSVSRQAR